MEEHEARGEVLVAQVGVEPADLRELGETLVHDGPVREARHREVGAHLLAQDVVEGEAQQVAAGEPAVLAQAFRPAEEGLAHDRGRAPRGRARGQGLEVDRDVGPAEHVGLGEGGKLLHALHAAAARDGLERQEEHAERDVALGDQADVVGEAVEEERPGDVEEEAGPVAGGAAVVELAAEVEGDLDEAALRDPLPRREEPHPARVGCVVSASEYTLVAFHRRMKRRG